MVCKVQKLLIMNLAHQNLEFNFKTMIILKTGYHDKDEGFETKTTLRRRTEVKIKSKDK